MIFEKNTGTVYKSTVPVITISHYDTKLLHFGKS